MKLTITQKMILIALYQHNASSSGEILHTYKSLEALTKLNKTKLKRGITGLRSLGLVKHTPAIDYDGMPCGSGFVLTEKGDRYIEEPKKQEIISK